MPLQNPPHRNRTSPVWPRNINAEPLHFVLEKFSSPMKKKLLAVGVAVLVSRCPRHTVISAAD